jgi:RecG-like helicase
MLWCFVRQVLKASAASRELAHDAIRREVAAGFRAYVVCPLVESSDADGFEEVRAAEEEYEGLKESGCLVRFSICACVCMRARN